MTNQPEDREIHHYYGNCCWPGGSGIGGALFWGTALIILGGVWLVANVTGFDNWGEWLIPALFVAWGAALIFDITSTRTGPRGAISDDR